MSALAMIVLPLWAVVSSNETAAKSASANYRVCIDIVDQDQPGNALAGYRHCEDQMTQELNRDSMTWGIYFAVVGLTALLCALVYGLIWMVVAVSKWVWRGRRVGTDNHKL